MQILRSRLKPYFDFDKRLYFLFICVLYFAIIFFYQEYIIYDNLYYQAYGEQLSYERIEALLQFNARFIWLNYVLIPLIILLRVFLVSLCLMIGVLLSDYTISFKKVFQIALTAEIIYLLPALIKTCWFLFFDPDYTLAELNSFDFYSMLAWMGSENLELWWKYLFYCLNLFEVLYWLSLAFGFWLLMEGKKYTEMLALVASSYGLGLLLWIVFITFLLVNIS